MATIVASVAVVSAVLLTNSVALADSAGVAEGTGSIMVRLPSSAPTTAPAPSTVVTVASPPIAEVVPAPEPETVVPPAPSPDVVAPVSNPPADDVAEPNTQSSAKPSADHQDHGADSARDQWRRHPGHRDFRESDTQDSWSGERSGSHSDFQNDQRREPPSRG